MALLGMALLAANVLPKVLDSAASSMVSVPNLPRLLIHCNCLIAMSESVVNTTDASEKIDIRDNCNGCP